MMGIRSPNHHIFYWGKMIAPGGNRELGKGSEALRCEHGNRRRLLTRLPKYKLGMFKGFGKLPIICLQFKISNTVVPP